MIRKRRTIDVRIHGDTYTVSVFRHRMTLLGWGRWMNKNYKYREKGNDLHRKA